MSDYNLLCDDENVCYEDSFCKLTPTSLILKTYYIPTGNDKTIELTAIQMVYYKKQKIAHDLLKIKPWGMNLSSIWWGCDKLRNVHCNNKYNVVIDTGKAIKKGFSVSNIEEFLEKLKERLPSEIPFLNDLP
uniref:Uncharacterized protein n=1 Tax=Acrobeloides nanus TaxID=290746 RepID=A0A914DA17_9BILA